MYVRLKHALSALALEAVRAPRRGTASSAVDWLEAFCDLDGGTCAEVPLADVAGRVADRDASSGATVPRCPRRVLTDGLLERHNQMLVLAAGYQPDFPYLNRQVHRLGAVLRMLRSRPLRGRNAAARRGAALFDGGLFFECHEYFEEIWHRASASDKNFYQGVILIAAAFYHFEKGNVHGARTKLTAGIERLRRDVPAVHGIRLDRWLASLAPWQARIDSGQVGVIQASEIPKIPFAHKQGSE